MGCLGSKANSEADGEEEIPEIPEAKVYSWDKRKETDKEKYFVKDRHGRDSSVFRNDVDDLPITIDNCSDCFVFLLGVTKTITVDQCAHVTIIAFSADSVYVRDSSDVTLIGACGQYRCRDCRRLSLFLHCPTQPVIESSQKVKTAPLIIDFDGIESALQALPISKFTNFWDQIHDFGPLGNEPNWEINQKPTTELERIYSQVADMFIAAPIVRCSHSFYPIVHKSSVKTESELSFVILGGEDAEKTAFASYSTFTQQKKIAVLAETLCRKSSTALLPERAKKQLRAASPFLIGQLFVGRLTAIDHAAYADPGSSYVSFQAEAAEDAKLFFSGISQFDQS